MELRFYEEVPPELPHPPIPLAVFLIVEAAIRRAWAILRENPRAGFDLASATEDPITHELYVVLYEDVFANGRVEGFNRELFTVGHREPKLQNFDGTSLDKMPDLLVALIGRRAVANPTQDGLFIECKPVDRDHPAGQHYCDKGLIRFVNGDYAWAMQEAMMVGYAREGYTISPKLDDALAARPDAIPTIAYPRRCADSKPTRFAEVVHASTHRRSFPYVGTCTDAPPITIRHLWLRRD